jgi:hypothetical protein
MNEMTEAELESKIEKIHAVKEGMAELFVEQDLDVGEVMSVLTSMLVSVALGQASMNPLYVIEVLSKGMTKFIELQHEEEGEDKKWLN